ncbi:MAG: 3-isopropylmalate dehydratase small subunit [Actinomycetota bacterium]|nr:3-isopropylmalate dehydratase small subunit [Actinomycetota bacterium]MDK1095841.1 3-isopropylmalate dehydratase small subunit [Actinomycetota bacterium]MDK1103203.1 3-isopropylmalate dehydratase small subunit [Actinomycetota bacterium]MDK1292801.1 3-isopropylmalate dehydratase small subunit [Actinomycetota bacterium]
MSDDELVGRVWRFDHDISTDVLSPGQFAVDPVEVRKLHVLESVNPSFASDVMPGDIVVAGRNFGCGSSRETAAENLKALGVACVVAESFARIFMRNAIALGLPVVVCPGAHDGFSDGDRIEIDLANGRIVNAENGAEFQGDSLPPEMRDILSAGGILAVLRNQTGH